MLIVSSRLARRRIFASSDVQAKWAPDLWQKIADGVVGACFGYVCSSLSAPIGRQVPLKIPIHSNWGDAKAHVKLGVLIITCSDMYPVGGSVKSLVDRMTNNIFKDVSDEEGVGTRKRSISSTKER